MSAFLKHGLMVLKGFFWQCKNTGMKSSDTSFQGIYVPHPSFTSAFILISKTTIKFPDCTYVVALSKPKVLIADTGFREVTHIFTCSM